MKKLLVLFLALMLSLCFTACNLTETPDEPDAPDVPTEPEEPEEPAEPEEPEEPAPPKNDGSDKIHKITSSNGISSAILYDAPSSDYISDDEYSAELSLDGKTFHKLEVWTARVAMQHPDAIGTYTTHTTYFVNFDFEGEVTLRITHKSAGDVRIRPIDKSAYSTVGKTTLLTLDEAGQFSYEVGGDIYGNLQIFANPIEEFDRNADDTIYLGPGLYNAENCRYIRMEDKNGVRTPVFNISSGVTLYLSGGAVLQAAVVIKDDDGSRLMGRGVIDMLMWNTPDNNRDTTLPYPSAIMISNSKNITVDGIIIRNPSAYCINGGNSSGVTVNNVKAIASMPWTDGFDVMACSDMTVKNSFFRTNDDCIAIYASRWDNVGSSKNYTITNCVLWADNAHAINIGSHGSGNATSPDVIENIKVKDIDILEVHSVNTTGAIRLHNGGENILKDMSFEDIRMEFTLGDAIRLHFVKDNDTYGKLIQNITFKNISAKHALGEQSKIYVYGQDDNRIIDGITFDNVTIEGVKVTESSGLVKKNAFAKNIIYN